MLFRGYLKEGRWWRDHQVEIGLFGFLFHSQQPDGRNSVQEVLAHQRAIMRSCDFFPGSLTPGLPSTCDPERFQDEGMK